MRITFCILINVFLLLVDLIIFLIKFVNLDMYMKFQGIFFLVTCFESLLNAYADYFKWITPWSLCVYTVLK